MRWRCKAERERAMVVCKLGTVVQVLEWEEGEMV